MQKKLIAAAITGLLAVPAMAQTNVTISGQMRVGVDHISGQDHTSRMRVIDNNSNIRFAGTESLGGGLSAWFQVESAIGTSDNIGTTGKQDGSANSTTIGTRNTGVGLKGAWGNVYVGKWDMHYSTHAGVDGAGLIGGLALGTNALDILHTQNGANGAGGRFNNAIMYDSPTWNGFNVKLGYSTTAGTSGIGNEDTADNRNKERNYWINPSYNNGPWTAFYSYLNRNDIGNTVEGTAAPSARFHRAGLAYTFAMGLKLGLIWDRNSLDRDVVGEGTRKRTAWAIPVQYGMGPHTFNFTYAKAGKLSNNALDNDGASMFMLGYTYALSKRTMVGVNYTKINNQSNGSYDLWHPSHSLGGSSTGGLVAGSDPKNFGVNLHHSF